MKEERNTICSCVGVCPYGDHSKDVLEMFYGNQGLQISSRTNEEPCQHFVAMCGELRDQAGDSIDTKWIMHPKWAEEVPDAYFWDLINGHVIPPVAHNFANFTTFFRQGTEELSLEAWILHASDPEEFIRRAAVSSRQQRNDDGVIDGEVRQEFPSLN